MATLKNVKGNPDPFAIFEDKKTDEYGLQIANVISREWFNGGLIKGDCAFMTRRDYVRNNRLFVRGEQDLKDRKSYLAQGGLEHLNISWKVPNWAEKFCRTVSNPISDDNYVLDIRSSDKLSLQLKEDRKETLRKQMVGLPLMKKIKEDLNVDLLPQGFVPETEKELDFLFETEERPKTEIFEELLIDYVKHSNDWDYIQEQTKKDLTDCGMLAARVWIDPNNGVMVDYVDIEQYIHSKVSRNDFKDKYYEGVVDTITLSDLRREADFTDVELRKIGEIYAQNNPNYTQTDWKHCSISELVDIKIDVLRFAWKTSKSLVYKGKMRKGKVVKVSMKDDGYTTPEAAEDVKRIEKKLDTWFEGNYVIGSNAIYNYKECENLSRDTMNKAMSPFVVMASDMYENVPKSFLDNIKPLTEDLLDIIFKIRALRSKLKPDMIVIDLDQLAELDDGKGGAKKQKWKMAAELMAVEGLIFTKRTDMGGLGIKDNTSIRPMAQQQGGALTILLNELAFQYANIRDITGVNPVADGSVRPDALVGVSQMAQLAFNNATKHVVNTAVHWNKKLCEVISTRINGVFSHDEAKHIQEMYIGVVGKSYVDAVEVLKNRHLHEFAFTFRFLPYGEELKEFNDGLSIAASKGFLDEVVAITAKNYARTNVKLALKYLGYHTAKSKKNIEESQMRLAENKSKNDAAAAKSKVQAELQSYKAKAGIDIEKAVQISKIKQAEFIAMQQAEQPFKEKAFEKELLLEQVRGGVKSELEAFREDRKDDRVKLEATQQSKMKDQVAPIDFTESGDSFDFDDILS